RDQVALRGEPAISLEANPGGGVQLERRELIDRELVAADADRPGVERERAIEAWLRPDAGAAGAVVERDAAGAEACGAVVVEAADLSRVQRESAARGELARAVDVHRRV